jgi:hypothetical protein
MTRSQQGVSLLAVAVILAIAMAALVAFLGAFRSTSQSARGAEGAASLASIKVALAQFASSNGRLPCPAIPTADTGDADPPNASATCNSPMGTVPWKTIGLRREESIDPWGFKISYRVYTGAQGSLTQQDGASAVKCECDDAACESTPVAKTAVGAGNSGGLCADPANTVATTYATPQQAFLNLKGLAVTDFGRAELAAYVLISHGPSGRGGYTASGTATAAPGNPVEIANMQAAGPFTAAAPMTTNLSPDDPAYFDDVIAYERLADLIRRANLGARDWPEPAPPIVASYTLDNATVAAAVGHAVAAGTLGTATLNLGNATLTSSAGRNLAFDTSGATDSIGVAGNGNLISSIANEYVRVGFNSKATQLGVTFRTLGTFNAAGNPYTERVQLTFYDGAAVVGSPLIESGCRGQNAAGGLTSFAINVGIAFDSVEVRPILATPVAGTQPSSIGLAAFKACTAAQPICASDLAAAGNTCP